MAYEFRVDENGFLSPGAILEQPNLVIEELIVPEWGGGKIRLKQLSAKERDDFESSMVQVTRNGRQKLNNENFRARLVQLAVVNEDGSPMFTKHDIKTLGNLPAAGLQRVYNKVNEMSAFSDEDLKELEEDFDDDRTDGSSSV
ncbi:hypothetical protein [Streptomyces roseolus]|uniref:hypothetical protein n=1 Tax=Streptomyces roseolus TaxID=67358 RepID=UPI00167B8FB9|nr:hypothetical protein [Streptomyces roseolus]GGR52070.1 hypothetical protein GCM10010282_51340 [Streptomyces roseolus]